MWFTLMLLALLLGIAVRQATQGFHGSFVTAALTCCCAALSLGTYEWVAITWIAPNWQPNFALPIALGVTFGIPLIVSRVAFDLLVRRACVLSAWPDRIGSSVCGIITAMIMVGIFAICAQMLPFEKGSILGYTRLASSESDDTTNAAQNELLLRPDRFAINIGSILSSGVFGSGRELSKDEPDLLQNIAWVGSVPPAVSRFAPPDSISVLGTKTVEAVFKLTPGNERQGTRSKLVAEPPSGGHEFHVVRVKLGNQARDQFKSHRFSPLQFRAVGMHSGRLAHFTPRAVRLEQGVEENGQYISAVGIGAQPIRVTAKLYEPIDQKSEVEIVFETPTGFKPSFLEYKRGARAALSFDAPGVFGTETSAAPPETTQLAAAPAAPATPPASTGRRSRRGSRGSNSTTAPRDTRRGGNIRGVTTAPDGSHFGDALPMTLTAYRRLKNAVFSRGAMVSGHLVGDVSDQDGGTSTPISKFSVPSDQRLLQLNTIKLQARSALGRIVTQALSTVQNYFVEDEQGKQYKIIGKYAIADVNRKKVVEVQYFRDPVGSIGGLGKFSRINETKLDADDTFTLLFLVDPGVTIVEFSTGGTTTRSDDLRGENLVAPD